KQCELPLGAPELGLEQCPLNLEPGYALEVVREPQPVHQADAPFGRIPLPPAHAVAIIVRELMVEIVIALAECQQRDDTVVARSVLIGVRPEPPHMGKRIDEES